MGPYGEVKKKKMLKEHQINFRAEPWLEEKKSNFNH